MSDYVVLSVHLPLRRRIRGWLALAIRPLCALAGHVPWNNGGYGCSRCWSREAFR